MRQARVDAWIAGACIVASAVIGGCTNMATPDVGIGNVFAAQVPFVIPPKNADASKIHEISIVPLANGTSQSIARGVEGSMIGLKFGEKAYYTKVTLGQGAQTNLMPPQALQSIAGKDQTQGVLTILFTGQRIDRRSYQEQRSECTAKGAGFKCPAGAMRTVQVACEERTAFASTDIRVFDGRSKKTVYSDSLTEKVGRSRCNDSSDAPLADDDLTGRALGGIVNRIVAAIAPTTQLRALDLMAPDAAVTGPAVASFQEALRFARAKRLDEACSRFADLYDGNKESTSLTYNVAFCDEASGDLVNAVSRYRRASDLAHGPNSQIDKHLNAVDMQIKEVGLVAVSRTGDTAGAAPAGNVVGGGRRVALVVGNARYQRGALANPIRDAQLMEVQLRKLGFEVVVAENVNSARFQTVVSDFITKSRGARVALFYYAGHAIQSDGENLLMPVDNESIRSMDEAREKSIALGALLAQLEVAAPDVKLIVLDSCRDSPLPSVTRSLSGGMAPIATPPAGALIAFATSPGQTATDGDGRNSVFTKYLARAMDKPNTTVEDVFKQVRADVQRETKNKQKPTEVSSLTGTFYFRPAP